MRLELRLCVHRAVRREAVLHLYVLARRWGTSVLALFFTCFLYLQ